MLTHPCKPALSWRRRCGGASRRQHGAGPLKQCGARIDTCSHVLLRIASHGQGRVAAAQQEPSAATEATSRCIVADAAQELFKIAVPSTIRLPAVVGIARTLTQGRQ